MAQLFEVQKRGQGFFQKMRSLSKESVLNTHTKSTPPTLKMYYALTVCTTAGILFLVLEKFLILLLFVICLNIDLTRQIHFSQNLKVPKFRAWGQTRPLSRENEDLAHFTLRSPPTHRNRS